MPSKPGMPFAPRGRSARRGVRAMSSGHSRLRELAEAERQIAAARKFIEQCNLTRATARGITAALPEQALDDARADWLTLELRRLEILNNRVDREGKPVVNGLAPASLAERVGFEPTSRENP